MSHNPNPQSKETPAAKSNRLLNQAKSEIERIVTKAAQDPTYFGTPSVELVLQAGSLEAIKVNDSRSIK